MKADAKITFYFEGGNKLELGLNIREKTAAKIKNQLIKEQPISNIILRGTGTKDIISIS